MNVNLLRGFLHSSREWARARRGMELFQMAAVDLMDFALVDSGFFVYRKRVLSNGIVAQKASVYAPWGVFTRDEEQLQILLDKTMTRLETLNPMMERWILAEDTPSDFHNAWTSYGLLEVGIWPLVSREQMIGAIVAGRTKPVTHRLTIETGTALMDGCAAQISLALDLILTGRIAEEASQRDLLTGLLNRRGLVAQLPEMVKANQTEVKYLVFGLIDLDELKIINDTQGHPAGDEALRQVADIITRTLRADDLVARFGGDEFAVLLQSDRPDAESTMKRIQKAIETQSDGLSVSVGGAVWGFDGKTLEQCYQAADERLYECKRQSKLAYRNESQVHANPSDVVARCLERPRPTPQKSGHVFDTMVRSTAFTD